MSFSENVLILRTGRFKESDVWVRFLTPSRGILTGFAFGGAKSRRRFCGCLDSLNLVHFTINLNSRKKYLVLEEGILVSGFRDLKNHGQKLGMAINCLRFVQQICWEGDDSTAIYPLMLDSLRVLEKYSRIPTFFPLLFKAKATFLHGYEPVLHLCTRCGKSLKRIQKPVFLFKYGRVACLDCTYPQDKIIKTGPDSLIFLDNLRMAEPGEWIGWNPEQTALQDCFRMVDAYIQYHLE